MNDKTKTFEEIIKSDHIHSANSDWTGTFLDYLEQVKADPGVCALAHLRAYDTIIDHGVRDIREGEIPEALQKESPTKVYGFLRKSFSGSKRSSRRSFVTSTRQLSRGKSHGRFCT